jgi:hypothetical protein
MTQLLADFENPHGPKAKSNSGLWRKEPLLLALMIKPLESLGRYYISRCITLNIYFTAPKIQNWEGSKISQI